MSDNRWRSNLVRAALAAAVIGPVSSTAVVAQQGKAGPKPAAAPPAPAPATAPANLPALVQTAVPTKPTDPIAVVNGETITRGQLADECVSRYGVEVLETLVARRLIQQAVVARKMTITAAEVNQEIDRNAESSGLSRDQFLRMLAKERDISPRQYADFIAYPALALRKLAEPRVQVTPKDLDEAYQASFGERMRCRVIMVPDIQKAKDVWNQVRANPAGFAKIAQEQSIDSGSASLGGLLAQPLVRFAQPRHVSEAAFAQLVDGDPGDKDPAHKPKDGDISGPIQVSEGAWIILKREGLEPAQQVDRNDPKIKEQLQAGLFAAKLDAEMQTVMEELMYEAAIDNKLTGQIKVAKQEESEVKVDGRVERMSKPDQEIPAGSRPAPPAAGAAPPSNPR